MVVVASVEADLAGAHLAAPVLAARLAGASVGSDLEVPLAAASAVVLVVHISEGAALAAAHMAQDAPSVADVWAAAYGKAALEAQVAARLRAEAA